MPGVGERGGRCTNRWELKYFVIFYCLKNNISLTAYCLQSLGVELGDSRDANGRHRFFQIELELIVNPAEKDKEDWFHFFDPFQQVSQKSWVG